MSYKFVWGVPTLRRKREFPGLVMVIPQHNGADVPIELLDVTDACNTLGVYTCPLSVPPPKSAPEQRSKQLQYMVEKGEKWCNRVTGSKLGSGDVWFSFFSQAKPSFSYGIVPVMDGPDVVNEAFQALYFQCLPSMGINRYIAKGWRMLPSHYQGLGLPNMALEKLAESLSWLQRHWE
jgi:hypothetical protein